MDALTTHHKEYTLRYMASKKLCVPRTCPLPDIDKDPDLDLLTAKFTLYVSDRSLVNGKYTEVEIFGEFGEPSGSKWVSTGSLVVAIDSPIAKKARKIVGDDHEASANAEYNRHVATLRTILCHFVQSCPDRSNGECGALSAKRLSEAIEDLRL